MTETSQRTVMRRKMRAFRQALTPSEQNHASATMCEIAMSSSHFTRASTIAFYWPIDGEINPIPVMRAALKSGKCCTLPVVPDEKEGLLTFQRVTGSTSFMRDKFGVWTPRHTAAGVVTPTDHDIILTPLVGYTRKGDRLGFGGGHYDRLFDDIGHASNLPLKVGCAHQGQEITSNWSPAPWDRPLDVVLTDQALITVSSPASFEESSHGR